MSSSPSATWRRVYSAMVSRPSHAMTTAWQLGVQLWLMRLAKAPCANGSHTCVNKLMLQYSVQSHALVMHAHYIDDQTRCDFMWQQGQLMPSASKGLHLGGGVNEQDVISADIVAGALQNDVVKVW